MPDSRNREPEFTVTDRRKFNLDDVLNSPAEETAPASSQDTAVAEQPTDSAASDQEASPAAQVDTPSEAEEFQEGWESPSEADQSAQTAAYRESWHTLDAALDQQQPGLSQQIGGASFERLVALISTQALIMMGALAPEGQQPRVDVVGARQQIDLLEVLKDKTTGNLDMKEQSMLDNTLFELRMMFIEIMNAFSRPPKKES
jgi:Domain of unknown function (DUF1844)